MGRLFISCLPYCLCDWLLIMCCTDIFSDFSKPHIRENILAPHCWPSVPRHKADKISVLHIADSLCPGTKQRKYQCSTLMALCAQAQSRENISAPHCWPSVPRHKAEKISLLHIAGTLCPGTKQIKYQCSTLLALCAQAQSRENISAPHCWPSVPRHKAEKILMLHIADSLYPGTKQGKYPCSTLLALCAQAQSREYINAPHCWPSVPRHKAENISVLHIAGPLCPGTKQRIYQCSTLLALCAQAQSRENISAPHYWPSVPRHKAEKISVFHIADSQCPGTKQRKYWCSTLLTLCAQAQSKENIGAPHCWLSVPRHKAEKISVLHIAGPLCPGTKQRKYWCSTLLTLCIQAQSRENILAPHCWPSVPRHKAENISMLHIAGPLCPGTRQRIYQCSTLLALCAQAQSRE